MAPIYRKSYRRQVDNPDYLQSKLRKCGGLAHIHHAGRVFRPVHNSKKQTARIEFKIGDKPAVPIALDDFHRCNAALQRARVLIRPRKWVIGDDIRPILVVAAEKSR